MADSQWISVEERLPETGKLVLVFDTLRDMSCGMWLGVPGSVCMWIFGGRSFVRAPGGPDVQVSPKVTHWMPLPEPPAGP